MISWLWIIGHFTFWLTSWDIMTNISLLRRFLKLWNLCVRHDVCSDKFRAEKVHNVTPFDTKLKYVASVLTLARSPPIHQAGGSWIQQTIHSEFSACSSVVYWLKRKLCQFFFRELCSCFKHCQKAQKWIRHKMKNKPVLWYHDF